MLRITGGLFGGRKLFSPPESGSDSGRTRPSQAKLRQALFNTIQFEVDGARVLDLYAGAGTLGFEALSRGAASVTFVESGRQAARIIHRNAAELGVESQVRVLEDRVEKCGKALASAGPFDLVLMDPPYLLGVEQELLEGKWWSWGAVLAPGARLYLEWGKTKSRTAELPERVEVQENVGFLAKIREKNYGDSILTTYRLEAP